MAGARFGRLAFGAPGDNEETLVVVFLRGGMDGLNVVLPIAGADRGHYETARPDLKVPVTGAGAALNLDGQFGLHPSMASLYDVYQSNHLSIVLAAGLSEANRSHFEAQDFMDLGTPGVKTTATGWLTRHLASATNLPAEIIMPAISVGGTQATSLQGSTESVNVSSVGSFNLEVGPWRWRAMQRAALRSMYESDSSWLHVTGRQALDAMDIVQLNAAGGYTPSNGAIYPGGSLGDHLEVVAQMMKLDLGLRVATINFGGWDTHNSQGDGSGGYFGGHLQELSDALRAFYQDLDGAGASNYTSRMTLVVLSEFGRRLRENADGGSDHGHANVMMVMSGNATGGIHGAWPGLAPSQLFDGNDLDVTTDFRRVLSEILIRRMANNHLGYVFPGYRDYQPLGVVSGTDVDPNYHPMLNGIFFDDFEGGSEAAWSGARG
jgi:uncharacterized protein (DUF1501 family)